MGFNLCDTYNLLIINASSYITPCFVFDSIRIFPIRSTAPHCHFQVQLCQSIYFLSNLGAEISSMSCLYMPLSQSARLNSFSHIFFADMACGYNTNTHHHYTCYQQIPQHITQFIPISFFGNFVVYNI